MPELPEVETTRRGIEPHIRGQRIDDVIVRDRRLRWPIPRQIPSALRGLTVQSVSRRAKYLLLDTESGTIIVHLGMSGSLRIVTPQAPLRPHDHVDMIFANGKALRFRDPRRFGAMLWTRDDPLEHELLKHLGPEPLGNAFSGEHLHEHSRGRRVAVKDFIMNSRVVSGVGNIYANEALFMSGIHPRRPAGRIALPRYLQLADAIRDVLSKAIGMGGTTLRDFTRENGEPGYFRIELAVYDRKGEPCKRCAQPLRLITQGQRATYYCASCQR